MEKPEMDGAMRRFAAKKLAALVSGSAADVELVVADPVHYKHKIVYASRIDLMACSQFFEEKIGQKYKNVRIILYKETPETVKLIAEFTFLNGVLLSEVEHLDQCLKLANAAQKYRIGALEKFCHELMYFKFLNLGNIWRVFDNQFKVKRIESVLKACAQFISERVKECLKQPEFLSISLDALMEFASIPNLRVDSEMTLVRACLKVCEAIAQRTHSHIFKNGPLILLRLKCLKADEVAEVVHMLEPREAFCLAQLLALPLLEQYGQRVDLEQEDFNFNPISDPRHFALETPVYFHKINNLDRPMAKVFKWKDQFVLNAKQQKFTLSFKAPQRMTISKVELLLPFRRSHYNVDDVFNCLAVDPQTCFELPSKATISTSSIQNDPLELVTVGDFTIPRAVFKAFNFVEKDSQVTIEICFNTPCFYRKASLGCVNHTPEIPFNFKLFERSTETDEWKELFEQGTNIFRGFSYEIF